MAYVERPYVPDTGRMSDLMRASGQAAARGSLQKGEIWGNVAQSLGQIASSTIGQLVELNSPRAKLQQLQLSAAERDLKRKQLMDDVLTQAGSQPIEQTIADLEGNGLYDEAASLRDQLLERQSKLLQNQKIKLDFADRALDQAGSIFASIQSLPEAERPAAYKAKVSEVRDTLGPELGGKIPDDYDPTYVEQAQHWGQNAKDIISTRRQVLQDAESLRDKTIDRHSKLTELAGNWYPTVDSQEEWDQVTAGLKIMGATPEVLAQFSPTYSPEAAQAASRFGKAKTEAEPGDLKGYLAVRAKELGRPLTSPEIERFTARYETLTRAPKEPTAPTEISERKRYLERWAEEHNITTPLTTAQENQALAERAAALRAPERVQTITPAQEALARDRKSTALRRAEEDFQRDLERAGVSPQRTSQEEEDAYQDALRKLNRTKEDIQLRYLEDIGAPPVAPQRTEPPPPGSMRDLTRPLAPLSSEAAPPPPAWLPPRPAAPVPRETAAPPPTGPTSPTGPTRPSPGPPPGPPPGGSMADLTRQPPVTGAPLPPSAPPPPAPGPPVAAPPPAPPPVRPAGPPPVAPSIAGAPPPGPPPARPPGPQRPARPMPKVGDIVMVRGVRTRITRIHPDGRAEGVAVP
jgi:hypothetical protein